jgi:predicted O-linked N-acetylglucosamine transferase (SPINDLY family)
VTPATSKRLRDLVQEGLRLQQSHQLPEAAKRYRRALQLDPVCFDALQLLGVLRFRSGDCEAGIQLLQRALSLQPQHAPTLNNLGNALRAAGRLPEALEAYQRAAQLFPTPPPVLLRNLGSALLDVGDSAQAAFFLQRAVLLAPDDAIAWCWLGHLARARGNPEQAIEPYRRATGLDPLLAEAHRGLGGALRDLSRCAESAAAYGRTLEIDPGYLLARLSKTDMEMCLASWSEWSQGVAAITSANPQAGHMVDPLTVSFVTDDPVVLRRYADAAAQHHTTAMVALRPPDPAQTEAPIRVGYLSADLRDHPVGRLLAGVLEAHDPNVVDVSVYALGPHDDSEIRTRIAAATKRFEYVGQLSDAALAGVLSAEKLDILVDLMGYTAGHRARVLAARPVGIQATWLGFPSTLGGSLADYLIADPFTIPEADEPHYAERIVRLPETSLPADGSRMISAPLARAAYGLREDAVVLCSFNQTRKLNPTVFGIWMDILNAVPDSVLWLAQDQPEAQINLRREAVTRGVAPERLVFAPRLASLGDHLARYCVADLALDTFPYGSHSTALDVLWAGCPLVSWAGRSFASRVCGSVLRAAGVPDLVAASADEYRRLILTLAVDKAQRQALRTRLTAERSTRALFDNVRFTRSLERAYQEMFRRRREKLPPDHLWIQ